MTDISPRAGAAGACPTSVPSFGRRRRVILMLALLFSPVGLVGNIEHAEAGQRAHAQAADRTTHRHVKAPASRRTAPTVAPRQLEPAGKVSAAAAPGPIVLAALQRAQAVTGTDAALLFAIARRESGFNAGAYSRGSSARRLMQFTSGTWLEVVRDYGSRHGLGHYAALLASVPRGSLPSDRRVISEVLRLRDNPHLASTLAAERLDGWRGALEQTLGREASGTDLYLVHLLGPAGARRFLAELARAPSQPAAVVVGTAARANRSIFVRDGRNLSLLEVYRDLARSLATDAADSAAVRQSEAVQVADAG
jgi:hypothetical protein